METKTPKIALVSILFDTGRDRFPALSAPSPQIPSDQSDRTDPSDLAPEMHPPIFPFAFPSERWHYDER